MKMPYPVRAAPKMRPPHPGSILRLDVMPALGVTVTQAARELGVSRQLMHGILAEKLPVSADTALRLGRWCGNGAYLWLALQRDRDLWDAGKRIARKIAAIPRRKAA